MPKEWSDDEIKALVKDTHKIFMEERDRQQYTSLHERFGKKDPDPAADPAGDGGAPPKKDPPPEDPDPEPKGRWNWWG